MPPARRLGSRAARREEAVRSLRETSHRCYTHRIPQVVRLLVEKRLQRARASMRRSSQNGRCKSTRMRVPPELLATVVLYSVAATDY